MASKEISSAVTFRSYVTSRDSSWPDETSPYRRRNRRSRLFLRVTSFFLASMTFASAKEKGTENTDVSVILLTDGTNVLNRNRIRVTSVKEKGNLILNRFSSSNLPREFRSQFTLFGAKRNLASPLRSDVSKPPRPREHLLESSRTGVKMRASESRWPRFVRSCSPAPTARHFARNNTGAAEFSTPYAPFNP